MTTNLDLTISMFISFILIAGILLFAKFSLRDFNKIEKTVIVFRGNKIPKLSNCKRILARRSCLCMRKIERKRAVHMLS